MKKQTILNDISIVVPVYNEQGCLQELYKEIVAAVQAENYLYELIFVNDGSTDGTEQVLNSIYAADPGHVRVITFDKNYGKAQALRAGFRMAHGDIIITMDADLQDNPIEISRFVEKINAGYDLVSGWKYHRVDSFIKNKTSKFYNAITSLVSGVYLHDHNCGFKAYRKEVTRAVPLTAQLHRYIPYLAHAAGFKAITEIPVHHRKRFSGKTKYGPSRFIYGITGLVNASIVASKIAHQKSGTLYIPEYQLKNVLT